MKRLSQKTNLSCTYIGFKVRQVSQTQYQHSCVYENRFPIIILSFLSQKCNNSKGK